MWIYSRPMSVPLEELRNQGIPATRGSCTAAMDRGGGGEEKGSSPGAQDLGQITTNNLITYFLSRVLFMYSFVLPFLSRDVE